MNINKADMGTVTPEIIIVPSKKGFLKAEELIQLRNYEDASFKISSKRTATDGSEEEKHEISRLQGQLKMHLSCPRIERNFVRTLAEWDAEQCRVKLLRKEGKFQSFGYSENKIQYLENYEALFLLELNRLELYYESVLVSVEQAYLLLLGAEKSKSYEDYLIYSTFSRAGYIVQKYRNVHFNVSFSEEDCIWEILQTTIEESHKVPSNMGNSEVYEAVKKSMESNIEKITKPNSSYSEIEKPSSAENFINFDKKFAAKRKVKTVHEGHEKSKRRKSDKCSSENSKSFLDINKDSEEYKAFREIFRQFDVVKLRKKDDALCGASKLTIDFDLHRPSENFKKSDPQPPSLRAIVLKTNGSFPNRSEMFSVYNSQKYKVPLIVITVDDSKRLQAFLYYFS